MMVKKDHPYIQAFLYADLTILQEPLFNQSSHVHNCIYCIYIPHTKDGTNILRRHFRLCVIYWIQMCKFNSWLLMLFLYIDKKMLFNKYNYQSLPKEVV